MGDLIIEDKLLLLTSKADELVLLVQEETLLQDMTGRLNEIGRCCGMEIIKGKRKVTRISRQT